MDICGYTSVSVKKKKNCLGSLGLWGNRHRKGGVMKEKEVVNGGKKRHQEGEKSNFEVIWV